MQAPLLSGRGHLLAVPTTAVPLFSPLFSGHQALDTLTLAIIQEYGETKQSPRQKVATDCGPVMLLPLRVCLKDRALFLLKIMLIYWPTSMSSQPWLSGHLPVPQGWPLNGGSAVLTFYLFHRFTVSIPWLTFPVALPFTLPYFVPNFFKERFRSGFRCYEQFVYGHAMNTALIKYCHCIFGLQGILQTCQDLKPLRDEVFLCDLSYEIRS